MKKRIALLLSLTLTLISCGPGTLPPPPPSPTPSIVGPTPPPIEDGVITGLVTAEGFKIQAKEDKTTLCHHTGSDSNPYTVITVDPNATNGQGNNDHSSHPKDIIPITDRNGDGKVDETDCTAGSSPSASSPIAGATVRLEGSDKKTKTNDKGEFKLEGAPVGKKFAIVAEKPDVDGKSFKVRQVVQRIESKQKTVNLGSLFLRQTGSLFGQITLAERSDFTGTDVFVAGTTLSSKTDKDGNFALSDVPEGEYTVTAFKEGFVHQSTQATLRVVSGKPTAVPPMALQVDTEANRFGVLKGTITGDNGPLAGATVSLFGTHLTQSHVAVTDEKGQYVIGRIEPNGSALMPEPQYKLVVHRAFYDTVVDFVSLKGGETVTKNLELLSQEITLGRLQVGVKDCDKKPVASALIQLDPAPAFAPTPFTDANGTLKLTQLFPGNYTVYVAKGTQKTLEGMVIDNVKTGKDGGLGALAELNITLGDCNKLPPLPPPQPVPSAPPSPITGSPEPPRLPVPPPPSPSPSVTPVPPAPTGLKADNVGTNSFILSWNAVANADLYKVYRDGILHAEVQGASAQLGGLNSNTSYQMTVSAFNRQAGESPRSAFLAVTTRPEVIFTPPPPSPTPNGGGTSAPTVSFVNDISTAGTSVNISSTLTLSARVTMSDGSTNTNLSWSSSAPQIAAINNSGQLTGIGSGTVTVTVTSTQDPSKQKTLNITVINPLVGIHRFIKNSNASHCFAPGSSTTPPPQCAGYTLETNAQGVGFSNNFSLKQFQDPSDPNLEALWGYDIGDDHILTPAHKTADIQFFASKGHSQRLLGYISKSLGQGNRALRRYSHPTAFHFYTTNSIEPPSNQLCAKPYTGTCWTIEDGSFSNQTDTGYVW